LKNLTDCPCCASRATLWTVSSDRNRGITDEQFGYYHCSNCGLVFIDPVPAQLERYYSGGYQPIPKSVTELRRLAARETYRLKPLAGLSGDLLEVGPWIGIFSINAQDAGFKVDAIEMSADASKFLTEKLGIAVTNTNDPLTALREGTKRYDVIAMWHSLEHLPNPWAILEAAANRLKPGGTLLVAIPNIGGWQAQTMRDKWRHLDAPRHLYFWAPNDLARLVNHFGLETVQLETEDKLSGVLARDALEHYIRSLVRIPLVRSVVAKLIAPIVEPFIKGRGPGAGITATFRAR
jgi:2-polyprenyl-3-methyl-5-hydroxy-6-metoxy-1,4-benzoquinol methylase